MWKINQVLPDGQDAGIVNAMHHWSEKLAGFEEHPECLKHALESLPAEPPSLPQFIDMCRRAPLEQPLMLKHQLMPEDIERNKERLNEIKSMLQSKIVHE